MDTSGEQGVIRDYREKCIDDHEARLRHLESNNKEQAKLFIMSEKLEGQIVSLDDKNEVRFKSIEKWMDAQIAIVAVERASHKETKTDAFSIIAVITSVIVLVIMVISLVTRGV